jgi:hypothetical protein
VWSSEVNGQLLKLHLAGINNQNFIMRDDQTGTWWQQVTGEGMFGPLKGQQLGMIPHDELSYGVWKREQPRGRVLRPDPNIATRYESADWEQRYARFPVLTAADPGDSVPPRSLVFGITLGVTAKAYQLATLQNQSPIIDQVDQTPVMAVLGDDHKSVRVFDRTVEGRALEFFLKQGATPLQLVDSETGSQWDFSGRAISGQLAGKQLRKIYGFDDYWFDWKTYHPNTLMY